MNTVEKLLTVAEAEVGYLEKKSNSQLDSKTANAGDNNYTKYARDLYPALQGQAWCDMFVDWCFVQAFGTVPAKQLIGGGFSAYTPTSAQYYKNKGQYHQSNPQPGDQIFFKNSVRICHTGIVTKVTETMVYTIEGNTSAGSTLIPNGGAVCRKSYAVRAMPLPIAGLMAMAGPIGRWWQNQAIRRVGIRIRLVGGMQIQNVVITKNAGRQLIVIVTTLIQMAMR